MQILYRYFRYSSSLFLFFLLLAAMSSKLHEKPRRKDWFTKKVHKRLFVRGYDSFLTAHLPFYVFLLLSSSTPSRFPSGALAEWLLQRYILLWVVFCVISWMNDRKYENLLQFNTARFFYKQRFFNSASVLLSFFMNWASNIV